LKGPATGGGRYATGDLLVGARLFQGGMSFVGGVAVNRSRGPKEQQMKRKKTYGFSVVLTAPTLSAKECDALYEAGCDDGTIVSRKGVTFIIFDRKADSLEQAIRSATGDVRAAGFDVKRVEMPALV
jgi:hypothetical protein